ncbi:MAG TPA: helix-turn-helix transcriptional regulator [Candidatus Bathyarchaeia archaeon]|nr:helix-turn-helix transcriptional regulator [Candidatus Bathyarchaeia archaeon]
MKQGISVEVGAQIKAQRTRLKWSQAYLGSLSGLTKQAIQQIEAGTVSSPLTTLERITDALGTSLAQVLPPKPRNRRAA